MAFVKFNQIKNLIKKPTLFIQLGQAINFSSQKSTIISSFMFNFANFGFIINPTHHFLATVNGRPAA